MASSGTYALNSDPSSWPDMPLGCVLYRIRHRESGHAYIGMTTRGLRWRLRMHKGKLTGGRDLPIYRALRKHGMDAFDVDVLAIALDVAELRRLEIEAIAREGPQYNCTAGGEGTLGYRHPPEITAAIAAKLRGRPGPWRGKRRDPSVIEKMRAANLANPPRYWLGKKRSPETVAKANATRKARGIPRPPQYIIDALKVRGAESAASRRKKVQCIQTGTVFESCSAASVSLGMDKSSVAKVAAGKRKQVNGMEFRYV